MTICILPDLQLVLSKIQSVQIFGLQRRFRLFLAQFLVDIFSNEIMRELIDGAVFMCNEGANGKGLKVEWFVFIYLVQRIFIKFMAECRSQFYPPLVQIAPVS